MPHEISSTDGVHSFADSKVSLNGKTDAWHHLGQPVGHAMTAEEALDSAYLSRWNVRKVPVIADLRDDPIYLANPTVRTLKVPNQFATVFENPINQETTPIGVVGSKYSVIQNEALTEFADALVDESGAHYETAGSLRNYSQVFMTMKLPNTMVLEGLDGKQDTTEWYVALFNTHDGSGSLLAIVTDVRVVCANTAGWAIRGAKNRFKIRHTSGWQGAVQEAREALGMFFEYEEAFEVEARSLFEQPFTVDQMKSFSESLVDLRNAKEGKSATQRGNEAGHILKLFVESPSIKGTAIAGTRLAAYNAVSEYTDHYQGVRGGGENANVATLLRATRTVSQASGLGGLGTGSLKDRAFALLSAN